MSDCAELSDYKKSGYGRGQMSPAVDMPTIKAQDECFTLANIMPQNRNNMMDLPPPSVPVVTAGDLIDSYVAKLVATLKGEVAPLWDQNSDGALVIRIPRLEHDRNVDVMKQQFESLCSQNGVQAFF